MKSTLIAFLLILGLACCGDKNNDGYTSSGRITGPDDRDKGDCACCGGWLIDIDSTTYNFKTLPVSNVCLDTATVYPVEVYLDWNLGENCSGIQYIQITKIERK